jgi:hypothetical protein
MIPGTRGVSFYSFILGESERDLLGRVVEGIFHKLYSEAGGL